ncbi:MAG: cell wall hydrolase [Erythrobacter sp.]|nr:cell wall hydrolase [Erythrobacter sp.]
MSFSSADGAEALAQADTSDVAIAAPAIDQDAFETVPLPVKADPVAARPAFVSREVVQPLPEPSAKPEPVNARSLHELVSTVAPGEMSEQLQCLASAVYFEARGEPLSGQLAVAQVIINRTEDGRFPASYCGVVHQRAQFSFIKNGRMPQVRTSSAAWQRAKAIARIAHEGMWESEAADAVFFHANYVRPSWSHRKTRTAQIDTHIFYR